MQYVKLSDGNRMPVRVVGRGKPVVLLHGFGMDAALWLPYLLPHSRSFKFYLPYLRGFGAANAVGINQADTLANYVSDLEDLLNHFEIDRFVLGGISLGALTALKWQQTGQSWNRVERYLHIDQSPMPRNTTDWRYGLFGDNQAPMFERFNALLEAVTPYRHSSYEALPQALRDHIRQVMSSFFKYGFSKPSHIKLTGLMFTSERVVSKIIPTQGWWNYVACMQSYLQAPYDFRDSLKHCTTPITLFTGMRSQMYPPQGQMAMQHMAPKVRVVKFHKSGHVPLVDEPLKFVSELGRFLRGGH